MRARRQPLVLLVAVMAVVAVVVSLTIGTEFGRDHVLLLAAVGGASVILITAGLSLSTASSTNALEELIAQAVRAGPLDPMLGSPADHVSAGRMLLLDPEPALDPPCPTDEACTATKPLGLDRVEAPQRGWVALRGQRGSRVARVSFCGAASCVTIELAQSGPEFRLVSRDGKLSLRDVPAPVRGLISPLRAETWWHRGMVTIIVGGSELRVERRRNRNLADRDWLFDLWLAERLATAFEEVACSSEPHT